jgi:single-stranded-DNA-specific exonuclease
LKRSLAMPRRAAPTQHPELYLALPPKPGDDPRVALFDSLPDHVIRKLLSACPGIATLESAPGHLLRGEDVAPEFRHRWSGRQLIPQRHQIVLERLPADKIVQRLQETAELAGRTGYAPLLTTVLYGRGFRTASACKEFIEPSIDAELRRLPPYSALEEAGSVLASAIAEQLRITIVADYDADGNCSAAIMQRAIKACGGFSTVIQPDRVRDGYGLSDTTLERVKSTLPHVVLTLDLGTSNRSQIEKLRGLGVSAIVVDHHELQGEKTAQPSIFVNPKSASALAGYQGLCASGLAWLLARSVLAHFYDQHQQNTIAKNLLPLAAIGTVADVMELDGLNRAIAWHGHAAMQGSSIPALQELTRFPRNQRVTGDFVGYQVGPVLNACGRILPADGEASGTTPVFDFLTTDDPLCAAELHSQLISVNNKRKQLERAALEQATLLIKKYVKQNIPAHCGVVLPLEGVHEGVVGLVAARLTESMQCPVIALARDRHGSWKGSGRATPQVSLIGLLRHKQLAPLIEESGGHHAAAGLRIKEENLPRFKAEFNRLCREIFCGANKAASDDPARLPVVVKSPPQRALPSVKRWIKEYRPDLIMTVSEFLARKGELDAVCSALEPCGRANLWLRVLLPRVKITASQISPRGNRRLTITEYDTSVGELPTQSTIEAFVFARSLAARLLEDAADPNQPYDVIIQPTTGHSVVTVGASSAQSGYVLLVQPTRFKSSGAVSQPRGAVVSPAHTSSVAARSTHNAPSLWDGAKVSPVFSSLQHFFQYSGITCLRESSLFFFKEQIQFVHRLMQAQESSAHRNLLYKVNTGGGKTVIAFFKLAQILSRDPRAKVLYLAPQNDLVEQTIDRARAMFTLRDDEIVELSGAVSATKREKLYDGPGRLFVGTPHTLKNDGDLSRFSFLILDEIHFMRGDQALEEDTRYPYRWVVEQCMHLAKGGHPIRFWAQSGTPAATRAELAALVTTLDAHYERAYLPTGAHTWTSHEVLLDEEYRRHLTHMRDAYVAALREFFDLLPGWVGEKNFDAQLSPSRRRLKEAVLAFTGIHAGVRPRPHISVRILPSRSEFLSARERVLVEFKHYLGEQKRKLPMSGEQASGSQRLAWVYDGASRLHELDLLLRNFEELRNKGRSSLTLSISAQMMDLLSPIDVKRSPRAEETGSFAAGESQQLQAFGNYKVRFLRRPELQQTLDWIMEEELPARLRAYFAKLYPGLHSAQSYHRDTFRTPASGPIGWQQLLNQADSDCSSRGKKRSLSAARRAVLNSLLQKELSRSGRIDCVERSLRKLLYELPEQAKVMIQCEEKTETQLLANRLKEAGFAAAWYAGKSVPKAEKLKQNLQAFRDGTVRILCCTSVGDTGHDIPAVTHCIRIVPLTSPIRNAQSRGRTARKEGLVGTYISMVISDPDGDFDQTTKYAIARQRERAMNRC